MRSKRVLTLLLAVCMVVSLLAPTVSAVTTGENTHVNGNTAAGNVNAPAGNKNDLVVSGEDANRVPTLRDDTTHVSMAGKNEDAQNGHWVATPSDTDVSVDLLNPEVPASVKELREAAELYAADDVVSAFVVMEDEPMVEFYGSISAVPMSKEELLLQQQDAVLTMIEEDVLDNGDTLEVDHQFTYLANAIVIDTEFGNLEEIAMLPGVKSVFLVPVYEPCTVDSTEPVYTPYTASAGEMSGVPSVWQDLGLTGSGMTIAVIDTGLDLDHPSFAAAPADPSMDVSDIEAVLEDLNASKYFMPQVSAEDLYYSEKVPFAFNYVDANLNADHSKDNQGYHGTHVAGIAAANKLETTDVVGMAPDAQIVVMKVFGANGGAYMDDIVCALEDAMTLGCDVANLSLGTSAGFSNSANEFIDSVYENLKNSDIIVNISAGNDGTSSYGNMWGTNTNTTGNVDNAAISSPSTYANVNSIASVDNAMLSAPAIIHDGEYYMYSEAIGLYVTFASLAGSELEYVMVPGYGVAEDFVGVDVEGKIAVVARGGQVNFSTKLANAEANGAVGLIVTNNEPGSVASFGMSMYNDDGETLADGVSGEVPAVLVSLATGEVLAAAENKTLTVSPVDVAVADEGGGQMSSFSSWGVAPDMSLLPDMAGVGGNVYSTADDGTYEYMSGTSMSSPQVAGMSALVVEYLKENLGIEDSEIRKMVNGLMMSTAVPVVDTESGVEASPRQQGAGLVNALNAVTSEAYLTVSATENNKPKAELGDNAEGKYEFTFTVHNFSDAAKTYDLSASLLTEAADETYYPYYGEYFMAGYDVELDGTVSFSKDSVTVPAGGTANVTVTITVSDEGKAWLDKYYPNGGYVEGFVYLTDEDGVDLSLPYLGFYGDWTKAPAFDSAYWYDNSFWGASNSGVDGSQYFHVLWTDLGGMDWVLGFNPYSGALEDENGDIIYDPANNVISNNGDGVLDGFEEIYLSLMRNATELSFVYTDSKGNVLSEEIMYHASKTMYWPAYGQIVPFLYSWYGTEYYDFTDAEGNYLPSGTEVELTITAKLDYEGENTEQSIVIPITLDTKAPEITSIEQISSEEGNFVEITVTDESSVAAVYLMNPSGTQILGSVYDPAANEDGTYTVTLDITGCGNELMVMVGDYGANEGYYDLVFEGENAPVVDEDALYAYRVSDDAIYDDSLYGWITLDKETAEVEQLTNDMYEYYALTAAEYAGGYIFAVDAGYNFLVMEPGLFFRKNICNLGINVVDMAFDKTTDTMYLTAKTEVEDYVYEYALYTVDLLTGELTQVATYRSQYEMPWAMTFVDGELYAIKYYYSGLYKVNPDNGYALEAVTNEDGTNFAPVTSAGKTTSPNYAQSMTYSEEDGVIYWAYYNSGWSGTVAELFAINVETLEYTATPFPVGAELVGVLTVEEDGYTLPESDEVTKIVLSDESVILKESESKEIAATTLPWNAPAVELTWTSSDESVATVENGVVTGVAAGRAEITASYGDVSATCVVNVVHIDGTVYAYNYYNGTGSYGDWLAIDLNTMDAESLYDSPVDFIAADYNGHDGNIYGYDSFGQFYRFNPTTGEATALGAPVSKIPMDMAYDYSTGFMYAVTVDEMMGMSTVHYVNLNNGALVNVADVYGLYLLTLACDTEGALYAMNADGTLFYLYMYESDMGGGWMPLSEDEGEVTTVIEPVYIMDGFGSLFYAQSMCFDHNSRKLVWACPETSSVYWIDIYAAEPYAVSLGDPTESGLMEFLGLYTIPEEIPELAYTPVESVTAEDMLILTGGQKAPSVSIKPLNATNQNITWTTDDETVAYVNEAGMVVGVSEGSTTLTGTLVDGENTLEVTCEVTVKASVGTVYGYVLTDLATMGGFAWAEIDDTNPNYPEYPANSGYMIYAQEYVDGKVYAYGVDSMDWEANWQFMTLDPETYEIESMIDMGEGFPFVYDMTYNYVTGTMYAVVGYDDSSTDVYMINMDNGRLLPVMTTEPMFMSIAAAPDGTLYAMAPSVLDEWTYADSNAVLYTLDVENGTYEVAFDTGVKSNMLASMTIDQDSGDLYWAALYSGQTGYASGLYLIDMETQASYNLGTIGVMGSQVVGLYTISDNYPETPAELTDVALTSTVEEMFVGDTVTLEAFVQPSGLDAELSWSTADESVATVDENGVVTATGAGVTTVTVTAEYNGKTRTATCAIIVYPDDNHFLSYNNTDHGWTHISQNDVSIEGVVSTDAEDLVNVQSATMVDGVIYGYDDDNRFFKTTEDGFVREYLGEAGVEMPDVGEDIAIFEVRDLAYDSANDRLLAIGTHSAIVNEYGDAPELEGYSKIYEVDMATGNMTELVTLYFDEYTAAQNIYALTVTGNGTVYVYETFSDYVCTVDMETGLLSKINSTSRQSVYGGADGENMAMEYDPITCDIYLLMTSNGKFYTMFKFDPDTNSLTNMGRVGEVIYQNWAYNGDAFSSLMIDAEHTHAWTAWTVTTEATCTEDGEETRSCLLCGETETAVVKATGHAYVETVVEATCTEDGYTVHTCANCGESYTDTPVEATGHAYDSWEVTKEPTETENGEMKVVCSGCGDEITVVLYAVLEGDGSEWNEDSEKGISIVVNAAAESMFAVFVDGVELDEDDYTVVASEDGMTIVLTPAFLATLAAGEHTLVAVYDEGMAVSTFTITAPEKDNSGSSDTGDAFNAVWIAALVVSLAGAALLVVGRKKLFVK